MTYNKSPTAQRPLIFLLAVLVCLFLAEGVVSAQKMMTGSAWRTQTIDTNIPKGTKIRVRTAEPIDLGSCGVHTFQGVVARNVIGSMGQVLVSKGAPVELTAEPVSANQVALSLNSVVTNAELFGARGSAFEEEGQCIVARRPLRTSAQMYFSTQSAEIPRDTVLTFRLSEPYVRVK